MQIRRLCLFHLNRKYICIQTLRMNVKIGHIYVQNNTLTSRNNKFTSRWYTFTPRHERVQTFT